MGQFLKFVLEGNSTCFGQFLCPSSGVFHCAHSSDICHSSLQARSVRSILKQNQDVPSWSRIRMFHPEAGSVRSILKQDQYVPSWSRIRMFHPEAGSGCSILKQDQDVPSWSRISTLHPEAGSGCSILKQDRDVPSWSRIRMFRPDPACKLSANSYEIYLAVCRVKNS